MILEREVINMTTYTVRLFTTTIEILECNIPAFTADVACDKMLRRFSDLYATDCIRKIEVCLNGHAIYYRFFREIA
jgi:hypothetical protein